MRTRRSVLVSVGGLIALAGCSQQSSQPSEESDAEGASGEFTVEQFRVGGENPDEYEAEFIAGSNASEVADELTPEVSYRISGASGGVETQVRYEYSDATIPEGEPLNETVAGDTHEGSGEYTQSPSMPDELVSEILQNPKNLAVTFRATDTGSDGQASREYELNFANSYVEQIQREHFNQEQFDISDTDLQEIRVKNEKLTIKYESDHRIGIEEFDLEVSNLAGLFSSNIGRTRIPYELDLTVIDVNGETYHQEIGKELALEYLNGNITQDQMNRELLFDKLWTGSSN